MLQYWLDTTMTASWKDIARALEQLNMLSLAARLKLKYLRTSPATTPDGVCVCVCACCVCVVCVCVCVCVCVYVCVYQLSITVYHITTMIYFYLKLPYMEKTILVTHVL